MDTFRRAAARKLRQEAAEAEFLEPFPLHANNGDETRYPNKIGTPLRVSLTIRIPVR